MCKAEKHSIVLRCTFYLQYLTRSEFSILVFLFLITLTWKSLFYKKERKKCDFHDALNGCYVYAICHVPVNLNFWGAQFIS